MKSGNENETSSKPSEDEDNFINGMSDKLQVYIPKDSKIRAYREFGERVSKLSNIPLPKTFQKKLHIFEWFQLYWDQLEPHMKEASNYPQTSTED